MPGADGSRAVFCSVEGEGEKSSDSVAKRNAIDTINGDAPPPGETRAGPAECARVRVIFEPFW